PDGLTEVRLGRRGTLFTFTNDYLFESPDPPVSHAVVDLEGGGRIYLQLTDCEPERVEIDMPLELTFRRLHDGGGFHNYFWKARPAA
ncbi:MAG: hydroxymethylglutaryl-CoA synthase, partial [Deltaproteobacteria bacterium]